MPFKSERQRRYMWRNQPDIARRWADELKVESTDTTRDMYKKRLLRSPKHIATLETTPVDANTDRIKWIKTRKGYRRKGVATQMLEDQSKATGRKIVHSEDLTDDGRKFAESFDKRDSHDLVFYTNRSTPQVVRRNMPHRPKKGYGDVSSRRPASTSEEDWMERTQYKKWLRVDEAGNTPRSPNYAKTQYRPWLVSKRVRLSTLRTDKFTAVRAKHKGKEIGHMLTNDGEIVSVGVDKPFRRQGIATRMYRKVGSPRHSQELTEDGRGFAAAVSKRDVSAFGVVHGP